MKARRGLRLVDEVRTVCLRLVLRPDRVRVLAGIALAFVLTLAPSGRSAPSSGAETDIGRPDQSFAGGRRSPTASSSESKLWWNDGYWWASMFSAGTGDFHIFRLDRSTQKWVDTGTPIDGRRSTRADALWDGRRLYVASHVASSTLTLGEQSLLYRFSYDAPANRYTLDKGFPVAINEYGGKALVIDKDSTGKLWATWVQGGRVYVNRTMGDDRVWGKPFAPPVDGTTVGDDVSSLVAFGGRGVGVLWSNQRVGRFFFAVHVDGRADDVWEPSEAIPNVPANDHVNLKADPEGRLFAAVKTSAKGQASPLDVLLVRDPDTGEWTRHTFGIKSDRHNRPIVLVDEEHGIVLMFATGPQSAEPRGTIYQKAALVDSILFPYDVGTPVIRDPDTPAVDDVTSTKQPVSSRTGLVVLASNNNTKRYWHHFDSLASPPLVAPEGTRTSTIPITRHSRANELKDAFRAARLSLFGALGLSVVLFVFAWVFRRREVALAGSAILVAAVLAFAIVTWSL